MKKEKKIGALELHEKVRLAHGHLRDVGGFALAGVLMYQSMIAKSELTPRDKVRVSELIGKAGDVLYEIEEILCRRRYL